MLPSLTVLLLCQLVGEVATRAIGLPVPGPVVGMALLLAGLAVRGTVPESLGKLADGLLAHLSLLFVPAGVGVLVHLRLVAAEWLPITVSLLVSTLVTVALTAGLMNVLAPSKRSEDAS